MKDEPDSDLLVRFVRGDADAFEILFHSFQAEVFRWGARVLRDAASAEDVVVDTFWRAWRGRATFDSSRSFGAWLRRIATNAALDHLRDAKWRLEPRAAAREVAAPDPPDGDVSDAVAVALRRLPPKLRVVATLSIVEGLPHEEVADALDIPLGTVKSRLFRATRALRAELERLGVHP
jgi:RNA polymerase sigma-70 factor, ECF subfamily